MCGIVLAGGNMYGSDVDIFEKLVYHDIERGKDSTGVMCYRGQATEICKFALPSDIFIRYPGHRDPADLNKIVVPGWKAFRNKQVKYSAASTVMSTQFGSVYVGHNRAATLGKVCDENAHPFQHGHITLVHNGTLKNQSLLPDSERFDVDSDNIAYSIATIGADETIQKLNGAYTLVWIDSSDETLHIIRNSERPFHLLEKTCGDWFGASEEDMLMWVLTRQKGFSKTTVKRHFECKVGVEYIFNISGKKMQLREEREHTLPSFHSYSASTQRNLYGNGWDSTQWDSYLSSGSQTPKTPTTQIGKAVSEATGAKKVDYTRSGINDYLQAEGYSFRVDQRLAFFYTDFRPYSARESYGCVRGFGYDGSLYYAVTCHNVSKELVDLMEKLDDNCICYGTVRSASDVRGQLTVALAHVTVSETDDNEAFVNQAQKALPTPTTTSNSSDRSEKKELFNGDEITYSEWAEQAQKQSYKCPICDGYLMWADIDEQKFNHAGVLVHFDCERYEAVHSDRVEDDLDVAAANAAAGLPALDPVARMIDGYQISKSQFLTQMQVQGGSCPYCGDPIDWEDIENCKFYTDGRTIMHEGCEDLDQYGDDEAMKARLANLDGKAIEEALKSLPEPEQDETYCELCRDMVATSEIDEEASRAAGVDCCKYCASVHRLPSAVKNDDVIDDVVTLITKSKDMQAQSSAKVQGGSQNKGVWVYTTGDKKQLFQFTEKQFKQMFHQGLGSEKVVWEEIDHPDVRIEQLGTKQFRYYRRPKQSATVTALSKKLSNGKTVNKALWMQINCCFSCHQMIPWSDAEKAQFAGNTGRIYCEKCYSKVGVK